MQLLQAVNDGFRRAGRHQDAAINGGMKPELWKKLFATPAAVEQMGAFFWQPGHEHQPFALFIAQKE